MTQPMVVIVTETEFAKAEQVFTSATDLRCVASPAGEGELAPRRENPRFGRVRRVLRLEQEYRLRQIELAGDNLHLLAVEAVGLAAELLERGACGRPRGPHLLLQHHEGEVVRPLRAAGLAAHRLGDVLADVAIEAPLGGALGDP